MKVIAISLAIGMLVLTQAQEPKQDRNVIHLTEVTCEILIDKMKNEQSIIAAWLQDYYLPEHGPRVIDLHKVLADTAKLREHCIDNPEDDIMAAAEAAFGK
jgi:hypothetical protein